MIPDALPFRFQSYAIIATCKLFRDHYFSGHLLDRCRYRTCSPKSTQAHGVIGAFPVTGIASRSAAAGRGKARLSPDTLLSPLLWVVQGCISLHVCLFYPSLGSSSNAHPIIRRRTILRPEIFPQLLTGCGTRLEIDLGKPQARLASLCLSKEVRYAKPASTGEI